jgi:hypothetical protein
MPFKFLSSISPTVAFNKDAFPNRRHSQPAGPNHSPAKTSPKAARDQALSRQVLPEQALSNGFA